MPPSCVHMQHCRMRREVWKRSPMKVISANFITHVTPSCVNQIILVLVTFLFRNICILLPSSNEWNSALRLVVANKCNQTMWPKLILHRLIVPSLLEDEVSSTCGFLNDMEKMWTVSPLRKTVNLFTQIVCLR